MEENEIRAIMKVVYSLIIRYWAFENKNWKPPVTGTKQITKALLFSLLCSGLTVTALAQLHIGRQNSGYIADDLQCGQESRGFRKNITCWAQNSELPEETQPQPTTTSCGAATAPLATQGHVHPCRKGLYIFHTHFFFFFELMWGP